MKIRFAFPVLVAGAFAACEDPDPRQSEPYKQLETEHQATVESSAGKDSTINDLFGSFNRIGDNLRMIREKEGLLAAPPGSDGGFSGNTEEWMLAEIRAIDSLLNENRALIARMRRETKGNKKELGELQRTVDELEKSMAAKDGEITTLKDELSSANSSLATLIEMYRDKDQLATDQEVKLNSAWYCVGTSKELRENGVLTKEGGFIGIGRSDKLNSAALNKDWFRQVDASTTTAIPVSGKKPKLVTSHPVGSYAFEGTTDLRIHDPEAFWSMSKYLVVVVE
ncbi:MAG: hypothetical protein IPJ76_02150 [Flavobacteriales bacterium]|nr:MAG: hypothetical protein IPJ76_02150 [Flavobacteriales bacterium]